jgi:hypothetical protein
MVYDTDAAATYAYGVVPVGTPSEAAAGLHGKWRGKVSENLTSKAHRREGYLANVHMNIARKSGPQTHTNRGTCPDVRL